jgi:hypothetical protein
MHTHTRGLYSVSSDHMSIKYLTILLYTFVSKMFIHFLSLFVSIEVSDFYVNVLSVIVFFSTNFSFLGRFLF